MLHDLNGFGVQSVLGTSKTMFSMLGFLQLSLNPNFASFADIAPDISSNLQLVATRTANGAQNS